MSCTALDVCQILIVVGTSNNKTSRINRRFEYLNNFIYCQDTLKSELETVMHLRHCRMLTFFACIITATRVAWVTRHCDKKQSDNRTREWHEQAALCTLDSIWNVQSTPGSLSAPKRPHAVGSRRTTLHAARPSLCGAKSQSRPNARCCLEFDKIVCYFC